MEDTITLKINVKNGLPTGVVGEYVVKKYLDDTDIDFLQQTRLDNGREVDFLILCNGDVGFLEVWARKLTSTSLKRILNKYFEATLKGVKLSFGWIVCNGSIAHNEYEDIKVFNLHTYKLFLSKWGLIEEEPEDLSEKTSPKEVISPPTPVKKEKITLNYQQKPTDLIHVRKTFFSYSCGEYKESRGKKEVPHKVRNRIDLLRALDLLIFNRDDWQDIKKEARGHIRDKANFKQYLKIPIDDAVKKLVKNLEIERLKEC